MSLKQKLQNLHFSMRHITCGMVFMCLGIYIRGGLVGVISGLVLGLALAELTHMLDAIKK